MNEIRYSDEELTSFITNGRHELLDFTFMLRGAIFTWYPDIGGYLGYLDHVPERAKAVRDFLRGKGRAFESLDEVRDYGTARNFPNLQKFLESIEKWKLTESAKK